MLDAQSHPRLDGAAKVSGKALFAGDLTCEDMLHAAIVSSTIPCGRLRAVHTEDVQRLPGVVTVITCKEAIKLAFAGYRLPLQSDLVRFAGEPVAVVVAASLYAARRGAAALKVEYEPSPPALSFEEGAKSAFQAEEAAGGVAVDSRRGDPDAAIATAAIAFTRSFRTPTQNHHPIEPHVAIASWKGDRLTVRTASQAVFAGRRMLAQVFRVPVQDVRIISPLLGGGFGTKGRAWYPEMTLAAMVARLVGRPVRLELTRAQMFTLVGRRPEARQEVTLASDANGRLQAIVHHSVNETSAYEAYADPNAAIARWLYACSNVATTHRCAPRNVPQSNPMRAPGEGTGSFALETALDELAFATKVDPLALRRLNYAEFNPHDGKPWSDNRLLECYTVAAQSFGWHAGPSETGRLREGRLRIGLGMATAAYPSYRSASEASVRLRQDGRVEVRCGTQDLGTGSLTVLAQLAASILAVPPHQVDVLIGDTLLPAGPSSGGAIATASFTPAAEAAAWSLRKKLLDQAAAHPASPLYGLEPSNLKMSDGAIRRIGGTAEEPLERLASRLGPEGMEATASVSPSADDAFSRFGHGAVFAEVAVDPELGEVRVRRLTAAYACGRILNPLLARSQYLGGLVCGIGMALHEEAHMDLRHGRIPGDNLGDYLIPVHADMPSFDIHLVQGPKSEPGPVQGIGMIGAVGTAAAIANAVFHATGRRVRELPLTLERVMRPGP